MEAIKAAGGPDMQALSKKAGLSKGYIHSILKQGRTPSVEAFLAVAEAAGVEPAWLLFGDDRFQLSYPIVGEAVDGESWRQIATTGRVDRAKFEPGPDAGDMIVIAVRGDANAPAYRDGDVLFCSRQRGNLHNLIVRRDCLLRTRDGRDFLKHVVAGKRPGTFTLRSINNPVAEPIEDVVLQWAAPIEWVKRGR